MNLRNGKKVERPLNVDGYRSYQGHYEPLLTKEKQKFYFDRKEWTLEPLGNHTPVRLQPIAGSKVWTPARITGKLGPRSYAVTLEDSTFRRNRRHIIRSTKQANKQHVMSGDAVDDEADNFDTKNNNSGLPDTSPPLVEVPPSPTKREFSSSLSLSMIPRHRERTQTMHQHTTMLPEVAVELGNQTNTHFRNVFN
ncbi:integrase core domain [Plakobranchus ocellatus]|uniref:Integrase core domain n=1 Tax=Plakobranchus ocellatus TaxID=259542 RepID=A0AAV3YXI0_9GAST|nr:integrase core domain [Plakobranchus ocellatus]